ncbi:AraC family transcriptional regulator [Paenibacillus alkalitolerans]|uniref:AraC family transcriptional regulator n=1 Tax=Paenibacillus alkalitolerans TaxID=2799335 RepID=UPI0018F5A5D8|nr:AraC family transcriptional regulator [Paenibacillus alkalitolerans]
MVDENIFPVLTDMELRLPLYLTSAGGWRNQDKIQRADGFPSYQWLLCLSGQGRLELGGVTAEVSEGQGMILLPRLPHSYYAVQEPWTVRWVTFHGWVVPELLERFQLNDSGVYSVANAEELLSTMQEAARVLKGDDPFRGYEGSSLLYRMLLDLAKNASLKSGSSRKQHLQNLTPMLRLIEQKYAEDLTLDELAGSIRVTPQYACSLFRRSFGMRPFEYITRYRLRKAKELLLEDVTLPVIEVGRLVGYAHSSYFIKLFKEHEGMTPSQFRRLYAG